MYQDYTVISIVQESFRTLWIGVADYAPRIVAALFIFLVGWLLAIVAGKVIWHMIRFIQLDKGLESIGFKGVWEKSGYKLDSSKFFYELVKWFVIIGALMVSTDILGLAKVTEFLQSVVSYLPNVFVATIILIIGVLVARFAEHAVRGSVKAAELHSANFLGVITRWVILVFSFIIALQQLGVDTAIINFAVMGVISACALGVGLAFGLGGKDHADVWLSNWKKHIQD